MPWILEFLEIQSLWSVTREVENASSPQDWRDIRSRYVDHSYLGDTSKYVLSRHSDSLFKSITIIIQTIIDYLVFQPLPQVVVGG